MESPYTRIVLAKNIYILVDITHSRTTEMVNYGMGIILYASKMVNKTTCFSLSCGITEDKT